MQSSMVDTLLRNTLTHAQSWQTWLVVILMLVVRAVLRALAERSRRKTLEMVFLKAPCGTVIRLKRGRGGPGMNLRIGDEKSAKHTTQSRSLHSQRGRSRRHRSRHR